MATQDIKSLDKIFNSFKDDFLNLLQQNALGQFALPNIQNNNTLKFTKQEINSMPKQFRKEFRTDGCTARVYKRKTGKNSFIYDIKYRRNGYNVIASNTNLEQAKKTFIEKLRVALPIAKKTLNTPPITFNAFAMYYFENFRKRLVSKQTYQCDLNRYKNHLFPYFKEKPLIKITSLECQELIDALSNAGKGKTTDETYSLLNNIFKSAIAHNILNKNPLAIVIHKQHAKKHGKSLTKQEEILLLNSTAGTEYQLMFAIILYTGMRPNEFETAKREGNFIVCKNSKRKNGKIETKKIPITPMLAPYIQDTQEISFYKPYTLREKFNSILPNHILYDLRTTFYSRCTECGIPEVVQKLFVGQSLGKLADAYTDLSEEYLLKEGNKL